MQYNIFHVAAGLITVYLFGRLFTRKQDRPLPPGPKPLPLIGNLLDMPRTRQWLAFTEWRQIYGDIVYTKILGKSIVVINSIEDATNLFETRGATYSDRPTLWMAGELMGWNRVMSFMPYGDAFKDIRRILHQYVGSRDRLQDILPIEEHETRKFLKNLMTKPDVSIHSHIRRTAGAIILKIGYDYELQEGQDPLVKLADDVINQVIGASIPGAYLVDVIPLMRYVPSWIPGAQWKRNAFRWRKDLDNVFNEPYQLVRDKMVAGLCGPNLVAHNIENTTTPTSEFRLKSAAVALYLGGADTNVAAITTLFLALTLFPEVRKKAQAEIDTVVGNERLPNFNDREHLPYINAICSEVLRWNPVAPLALPHQSSQDDVYKGYHFEKGTIFIANMWGMLQDPKKYSNPLEFRPERFLPGDGKVPEENPRLTAFGFGRRICPGIHLVEASLFISCAMSLAVFDISGDEYAGDIPKVEFGEGGIRHPLPFPCHIKPRSPEAEALILSIDEQ